VVAPSVKATLRVGVVAPELGVTLAVKVTPLADLGGVGRGRVGGGSGDGGGILDLVGADVAGGLSRPSSCSTRPPRTRPAQ
jgi:hypothetical protein